MTTESYYHDAILIAYSAQAFSLWGRCAAFASYVCAFYVSVCTTAWSGTFLSCQESTQRMRAGEALTAVPIASVFLFDTADLGTEPPSPAPLPARCALSLQRCSRCLLVGTDVLGCPPAGTCLHLLLCGHAHICTFSDTRGRVSLRIHKKRGSIMSSRRNVYPQGVRHIRRAPSSLTAVQATRDLSEGSDFACMSYCQQDSSRSFGMTDSIL